MENKYVSLQVKCPYCMEGTLLAVSLHPISKSIICSQCKEYDLDI